MLQLEENPMNLSNLSRSLELSLPETSRHIARLLDVDLIRKNPNGLYSPTFYGDLVLSLFRELEFLSNRREYFLSHSLKRIPPGFTKRIGDLANSVYINNAINFLNSIENLIKDSNEYVWFIGDEYIISSLYLIDEAIERGVKFKILELDGYNPGQEPSPINLKDFSIISRPHSPMFQKKNLESIDVFLYLSEKMVAIAFPTEDEKFNYLGFTATDKRSISWCRELFQHYWDQAKPKVETPSLIFKKPRKSRQLLSSTVGSIIVEGSDDSSIDYGVLQDAVDNYDEVILRGTFNLGSSGILISKSCILKGERRENGVPITKIYKTMWQVPFTTEEWLIRTKGNSIDVTIENIHFTDFNGTCIEACGGNSITIKNNRITLETGFARGRRHPYGEMVIGILVGNWNGPKKETQYYPGGVSVSGNYLDFALSHLRGGYLSPKNRAEDPNYRPNLLDEYYIGAGIFVIIAEGSVDILDNKIRNMSGSGIIVQECFENSKVNVLSNDIVSEIYGAYTHGWSDAGFGITAHSILAFRDMPGYRIKITNNMIKCIKINFSGINICGPFNTKGYSKFLEGCVTNNRIHLANGAVGIKIGRNDGIIVTGNILSGRVYYGMKLHGRGDPNDITIYAEENQLNSNEMRELEIKDPDIYSDSHANGVVFASYTGKSQTAHLWLDSHTKRNIIQVRPNETVINEGQDNVIKRTS